MCVTHPAQNCDANQRLDYVLYTVDGGEAGGCWRLLNADFAFTEPFTAASGKPAHCSDHYGVTAAFGLVPGKGDAPPPAPTLALQDKHRDLIAVSALPLVPVSFLVHTRACGVVCTCMCAWLCVYASMMCPCARAPSLPGLLHDGG